MTLATPDIPSQEKTPSQATAPSSNRTAIWAMVLGGLAYGIYKACRPVDTESCASDTCASPLNRTLMRSVMWLSLIVVIASLALQYFAPTLLGPF